jgi:hypothetical protein
MKPESSATRKNKREAVMETLLLLATGAVVVIGGVIIVRKLNQPGTSSDSMQLEDQDEKEDAAWRERAHDVYVAGHRSLGELTVETISACEPGDAGTVRREWLKNSILRTQETSDTTGQLSSEATTPQGRIASDALTQALHELAESAAVLLDAPDMSSRRRLAEANHSVETTLVGMYKVVR